MSIPNPPLRTTELEREYTLLKSKLLLFIAEIKEILSEDFPYDDSRKAATILLRKAVRLSDIVEQFRHLKGDTKAGIALDAYKLISRGSAALGIIARSGTTRNAFEMYEPFRLLASRFFEGEPIYLILSSEWNFVPFTLPMTLEELPRFIVIGLPASESDNILIFPTAAHELGHSVWRQNLFNQKLSMPLRVSIETTLSRDKSILENAFPNIKPDTFETDLFGKRMRDNFSNLVYSHTSRQLEELFCDLIGLGIFGRSYLQAFEYVIAPGIPVRTTGDYPAIRDRASILNSQATKKNCGIDGYERAFSQAMHFSTLISEQAVTLADRVRNEFVPEISRWADAALQKAGVSIPSQDEIEQCALFFQAGIPVRHGAGIGVLVSAAWETMFKGDNITSISEKVRHLSDLVLKSVEVGEFQNWLSKDAR